MLTYWPSGGSFGFFHTWSSCCCSMNSVSAVRCWRLGAAVCVLLLVEVGWMLLTCVNAIIAIKWTRLSKCGANVAACTPHMVAKISFTNFEDLGVAWIAQCWGSWRYSNCGALGNLVQKCIEPKHVQKCQNLQSMANCSKICYYESGIYFRHCWQ